MKNKKLMYAVIALVIVLFAIVLTFYFDGRHGLGSRGATVVPHSKIVGFDANINKNAENYPGEVVIKDLVVVHTKYEQGVPIIRTIYDSEETRMEWLIEYEGENGKNLEKGDVISIAGVFKDEFKTYEGQEDDKMIWTISFIADEIKIQK
jgi:hypothetical protein